MALTRPSPPISVLAAAAISTIVYALLAIIFTFPLALHLDSGVLHGLDSEDALQQTWVLSWVQHAITHRLAIFDAPIFYPTAGALSFHDNLIPLAILALPLHWAGAHPLVIYNLAVISSYPLCGLAMFPLARRLTMDSRAAFLAGLIFAFCPYRERHVEHLNLLSAEGAPLLVLCFEMARMQGGAWRWLALGLCVCLSSMLSLYYLAFTVLAISIYAGILLLHRETVVEKQAWRGSWAVLPPLLGAAFLLQPYLRAQGSVGGERRLHDIVYFSADIRDYLHAGPQSVLYGWTDALWHINPLDVRQYLFPGWIAVGLALGACMRRTRQKRAERNSSTAAARAYALVCGCLVVLSLGPYLRFFGIFTHLPMPYFIVYLFVPGYAGFRDVGRFDQIAMVFLAGAAAIGAAKLFRNWPRASKKLVLLLAIGIALEYFTVQQPLLPVAGADTLPPVYRALALAPPGVVAELPMCGLPGPPCLEESYYMYYSIYHWHPLMNGGGGFFPPDWDTRIAALATFPSHRALTMLRFGTARYLVIHPDFPNIAAVSAISQHRAAWPGAGISSIRREGADLLIVLRHDWGLTP